LIISDNQAQTCLIITINDTSIGDLPLIITISDTCKNQPKRLDFDNTINLSSLIVSLGGEKVKAGKLAELCIQVLPSLGVLCRDLERFGFIWGLRVPCAALPAWPRLLTLTSWGSLFCFVPCMLVLSLVLFY
jgi:hypothetical protein